MLGLHGPITDLSWSWPAVAPKPWRICGAAMRRLTQSGPRGPVSPEPRRLKIFATPLPPAPLTPPTTPPTLPAKARESARWRVALRSSAT